jgi:hypothetical protein
VEAFVEHWSSSDSATEVVVAELHADVSVGVSENGACRAHVWGDGNGLIHDEHAGVVTVRGRRIPAQSPMPPEVTLEVPEGCALTLRRVTGTVRIGDLDGRLRLDLAGAVDVQAGRVETARVRLRGRGGRISIAAVEGDALDIELIGTGRVNARGRVDHLLVRVLGSGNVCFHGDAQSADLNVDGNGYINVLRVLRHLRRWCIGAGDVNVAHKPRPEFGESAARESVGVERVGG